MKRLTSILALGGFLCFSAGLAQETSPSQTNPTQNKDVPKQGPGTNNPDMAPGHSPAPGTKSQGSDRSGERDVPKQNPGTNNPDVAKQRHATPKKHSRQKSTDQSGTTQ